jgi:hypothetical protein
MVGPDDPDIRRMEPDPVPAVRKAARSGLNSEEPGESSHDRQIQLLSSLRCECWRTYAGEKFEIRGETMSSADVDLVSLLKVFDANYVSDEDVRKTEGLNINNPLDIRTAVNALLVPEFDTYSQSSKTELIAILRACVADPTQDYGRLFRRISLIFHEFEDEPKNRRAFMSSILTSLEAAGYG